MSGIWPLPPFTEERRYRVKRGYSALRDTFVEGELMTYHSRSWSRYDGITGHFFSQTGRSGLRVWDVADGEPSPAWEDYLAVEP